MALDFKKCKTCSRIFQGYSEDCPDCIDERERQFVIVKDYIWDNPRASMQELTEETGVDSKVILRFLKEGRLEMVNSEGVGLTCEKCGKTISSGKLCRGCMDQLSKAMDGVLPQAKEPDKKQPLASSSKDKLHVIRK